MGNFSNKAPSGGQPTEEDWNNYLIDMHRRAPGMTPLAYAKYTVKSDASAGAEESVNSNRNSYEVLAETLDTFKSASIALLDLACGDGHLIPYCVKRLGLRTQVTGVDMAEGELAVARKAFAGAPVRFECAKAQSLPLANSSVDAVLGHMAFMLMVPLDPVVGEIARVLKSNGLFAAVVGNPKTADPFVLGIRDSLLGFLKREFPKMATVKYGDDRVRTRDGLESLFNRASGFSGVEEYLDFELSGVTDFSGVWDMYKNVYTVSMMPDVQQMKWKEILAAFVEKNADSDGRVHFAFPMIKFVTKKISN